MNISCFAIKNQCYLNFISSFSVVRYKLLHCSVPSKITGKQGNLWLFMSEKSLELSSTYFARNYEINEISCNKCWKKRQQLHDCFYMQKKFAEYSFDCIEEWLVNVAEIVSALKLNFLWSKKIFILFLNVIMVLVMWKAKKQLLLFTLLMIHSNRGSSLFFLSLLKGIGIVPVC